MGFSPEDYYAHINTPVMKERKMKDYIKSFLKGFLYGVFLVIIIVTLYLCKMNW
ncbi:MAG: hypothetical protein Q7S42_01350 [Candidatus Omnitrophota bacterium]|nr:hypothetical protein [Candidatus Omnitrophota bacterium]